MLDLTEIYLWTLSVILACTDHCRSDVPPVCHVATRDYFSHSILLELSSSWKSTDVCRCSLSSDNEFSHLEVAFNRTQDADSSNVCGPYLEVESRYASPFSICPYVGSQGATVRQNSNITVVYWADTEMHLPPAEIWFTRIMRGLVVSFSFLVFCGLLALLFFLNKRCHIVERLKKSGGVSSKVLTTKQRTENGVHQPSNGYDELSAVSPSNKSQHPHPSSSAPTLSSGYLNKAYLGPTPQTRNQLGNSGSRSSNVDGLSDQSMELEIQPYASFSEVQQSKVRQDLVGRGALNAFDIRSFEYKSSLYSTSSNHQVKPLSSDLDPDAVYCNVTDSIQQILPSTESPECRLDSEAVYAKVNKPPKNTSSAPAANRVGNSIAIGDIESDYVLPDSLDV